MSTFEEVKERIPGAVKYLDYGFVALLDVMGSDRWHC